jgi:hypothetical protein
MFGGCHARALTDLVEATVGAEYGDAAIFGEGSERTGATAATLAAGHPGSRHRCRRVGVGLEGGAFAQPCLPC